MEIVIKTIRIIDYENNAVYVRETPETFSEYVSQLITYINGNTKFVRSREGAELRVMRKWKWIFFPARSLTWRPWIMYRT